MSPQFVRRSPAPSAATSATRPPSAPPAPPSTPFLTAVAVLAIEFVALVVVALVLLGYLLAGHHRHNALDAWFVAGFAVAGAVALGVVTQGLWRRRRWSRAPAVLIQLLTLPIGVNAVGNGVWWVALPLLACGIAGLAGLFAPPTTRALFGDASTR